MRERLVPEQVVARGPGRVNLIGEHTDYNDGLALPFAIERGVTVTAEPLARRRIEVARALDLGEHDEFALDDAGARATGWRAFVRGMVAELQAAGYDARGRAGSRSTGDLPQGSGLSSSAALEAALCLALLGARRRGRARRPRELAQAVLARRERLGRRRDRAARPARVAVSRSPATRCGSTSLARGRAGPARARRLAARHARLRRRATPRRLGLQRAPRRVPRGLRGARHRLAARRARGRPRRACRTRCAAAPAT